MKGFPFLRPLHRALLGLVLALTALPAAAQTFCVFDVLGTQGPFYGAMREYWTMARKWEVTLDLKPYTNEEKALEDFNAGQCDMVSLTGIRSRDFNLFAGSIEAIGGLNSDAQARTVIETVSRPEASKYMTQNGYEIAGVLPFGGAYLFLADRAINSVDKIKGKRIAVLAHDLVQLRMVERIGFQPLASDIDDFALKFNQHKADMIVAPGFAYMPLELFKGVGNKGLVLKMPLSYLTLQVVMRADKFPNGFGQNSRQFFASQFDSQLRTIQSAEQDILYFLPPPDGEAENYQTLLRDARISMTAEGIYDARMIAILKKVRCRYTPEKPECSDGKE